VAGEEEHRKGPRRQLLNEHLETIVCMSDERGSGGDPYQPACLNAEKLIFELAVKVSQNPGEIEKIVNVSLLTLINKIPFRRNPATFESSDSI
jgi:hypothetical protein